MPFLPIVGTRHHPPANAILCVLPVGTELELLPEPTNPHDANAIMVYVAGENVPQSEELDSLAMGYGETAFTIHEMKYILLGYIARQVAATLAPFEARTATFALGSSGAWLVAI